MRGRFDRYTVAGLILRLRAAPEAAQSIQPSNGTPRPYRPAFRQSLEAAAALDRFTAINTEIVTLSRRNSNVRSLALSLGRKRTVTALCDVRSVRSRHRWRRTISERQR
jgi:hypothetical protein